MEDFDREHPLFDERLPILVQHSSKEEKMSKLTVRILSGSRHPASSTHKERLLRVEVTDDAVNAYFLYTLEVSEEDFHELKQDQRLLVDFHAFPRYLMELLQCCMGTPTTGTDLSPDQTSEPEPSKEPSKGPSKEPSKRMTGSRPTPESYVAVLQASNSDNAAEGTLSVVETNSFKQLTHLSLRVKSGQDADVKQYLASRLNQIISKNVALDSQLKTLENNFKETSEERDTMKERLVYIQQQHEQELNLLKVQHTEALTKQREEYMSQMASTQSEHAVERKNITDSAQKKLVEVEDKLSDRDASLKTVTEEKYRLEARLAELEQAKQHLEARHEELKERWDTLRDENKALDAAKFSLEKSKGQLEAEVTALLQQIREGQESAKSSTKLFEASKTHEKDLEESLALYKSNYETVQRKLEGTIQEIHKGNDIIQRIQEDNRHLRTKVKMKTKVLKHQETLLQQKQKEADNNDHRIRSLEHDVDHFKESNEMLKSKLEDAKSKLEESNALLQSNQQVISWLNKEINQSSSVPVLHPSPRVNFGKENDPPVAQKPSSALRNTPRKTAIGGGIRKKTVKYPPKIIPSFSTCANE